MAVLLNWNPDALWREEPLRAPVPDLPLREQVLDFTSHLAISREQISLGAREVRLLSVKRYPESAPLGEPFGILAICCRAVAAFGKTSFWG